MRLRVGRVFRKLGLPFWTFLGIGVSAIWFSYFGTLLERIVRDVCGLGPESYVPTLIVFSAPFAIVGIAWIWQERHYALGLLGFTQGLQQPKGKRGLILLISNADSALWAIEYHFVQTATLERVWLIPSNDQEPDKFGPNSRPFAEEIKNRCAALTQVHGRKLVVDIIEKGVSPGDAQDTFDKVNGLYRQSGYEPIEIGADFTGGTKPMSIGMIMACLPAERELEYVAYNPKTRQMSGPFLIDYQHSAFDLIG